jgi:salicylate hydroxylase
VASVLIAGAGIGGLTAALALARQGVEVALFDQAERLEETGAGIQLSPNATGVLVALELAGRLAPAVVTPTAIRVRAGGSGRDIAVMPLGGATLARYGTPYWVIHRAELQRALLDAVASEPRITLTLGAKVDDIAVDAGGVRAGLVHVGSRKPGTECRGAALIGADGLWSSVRAWLGDGTPPRFAGRVAWRAVVPAANLPAAFVAPEVNLWIAPRGHIVHYPIRAGAAVNIVAVAGDLFGGPWRSGSWTTDASRDDVLARFAAAGWAREARELLSAPERWQKWALHDRDPSATWGRGPVTLLGDAAHAMLPFLAQGAAMAIEDAAVVARELGRGDAPAAALRRYEAARQPRTARVQRGARRNDLRYHLGWPASVVRDAVLRALGGERLFAQYEWIYRWRA